MVAMRVGGRYRLRNGEVWTCGNGQGGAAYCVSSEKDQYGNRFNVWVDKQGKVSPYGDNPRDVIAEVTDDATSEPRQVQADEVNHPPHYTSHPSGVECITITRHMNFNLGNAFKYIWRAGLKSDDAVTDLHKAVWYLTDEIKRLKGGAK